MLPTGSVGPERVSPTDVLDTDEVVIATDQDVVRVRQATRAMSLRAALSLVDQTKVVTASSELARNTLMYGGGGLAVLKLVGDGPRRGVRLTFADDGPGIADVDRAMTDGYSTGGGLGLGLSGARRLVDEFRLDSERGKGTRVVVVKWGR
jgi:serine/threonine-protein kinase RsbT